MPRSRFWRFPSICFHLNWQSLQVRLTIGIMAVVILSLGSVAIWTAWSMEQVLVTTHKQGVEQVARRFPRDVILYSEMLPLPRGIQKTIDNLSSSQLLIWVTQLDGQMIAKSAVLEQSQGLLSALQSITGMPIRAKIYRINDRYLVLCGEVLVVRAKPVGNVYVAQDITSDQMMLLKTLRNLGFASLSAIVLTAAAIALYIRRSLRPLRQINQIAKAISVDDLGSARLTLDHAPSEVKELAGTMDMMLSRLSDAWEQQREFVSNVSHELRTPLTVVQGYLQSLLRRGTNLSDPQREALETAAAETNRTIRLLRDLLDLARADSGYLHVMLESLLLNDLVVEVASMTERVSDRQLIIETVPEEALVRVKADRDRLQQVLINLVDNAVKYSASGQPIHIRMVQKPDQVLLQVQDYGSGIPLQHQSRIFERFYRVDEARNRATGGVGLGLAIVKTLVEGMGGTIVVHSKPGEGSTFTVSLMRG